MLASSLPVVGALGETQKETDIVVGLLTELIVTLRAPTLIISLKISIY